MDKFGDSRERKSGATPRAPSTKAPYRKPVLETYGAVAELTRGGKGSQGDGPMSTKMSDVRTKQDIVRVGTHPSGVNLYAYRYRAAFRDRWGHGIQFGVLAHEVESAIPAAVIRGEDGYRRVDYAVLAGLRR